MLEEGQYFICGGLDFIFKAYELERNTTVTLDYTIPRKAFLNIAPENLQAMQAGDAFAIELEIRSGKDNTQSCTTLFGFTNAGTPSTHKPTPVAASNPLTLRISKTKKGTATETIETFNLKPGEHFTYEPVF